MKAKFRIGQRAMEVVRTKKTQSGLKTYESEVIQGWHTEFEVEGPKGGNFNYRQEKLILMAIHKAGKLFDAQYKLRGLIKGRNGAKLRMNQPIDIHISCGRVNFGLSDMKMSAEFEAWIKPKKSKQETMRNLTKYFEVLIPYLNEDEAVTEKSLEELRMKLETVVAEEKAAEKAVRKLAKEARVATN